MVVPESDISSKGEVNSPMQTEEQHKNSALALLGRQSSIYSLTLDEFQHTLIESGKHFGSMNMDEFLSSIWAAEENQAHAHAQTQAATATTAAALTAATTANNNNDNNIPFLGGEASTNRGITKQHSLSRQGSLSIPGPLCRKTVDEVWSEIHKGRHDRQQQQQQQQQQQPQQSSSAGNNNSSLGNPGPAQRQPTFGEMTLEDFLIKAGVVREQCTPTQPTQQPPPYGLYQNSNSPVVGPGYVPRPVMGLGGGAAGGASMPIYQGMPPATVGGVAEPSGYSRNGKRSGGGGGGGSGGYPAPPSTVCYSGVVGNGGGYGPVQGLGLGSPVSPVSSDGMGGSQMDGANYGMDMSGIRGGRKRIIDGPVEKVVERRQRRMIKNRESAARSRARKQAYTVELEAELNQLKEENAQLKQALAEIERQRKQQYLEEAKKKAQTRAQKDKERLLVMRRNMSSPL